MVRAAEELGTVHLLLPVLSPELCSMSLLLRVFPRKRVKCKQPFGVLADTSDCRLKVSRELLVLAG